MYSANCVSWFTQSIISEIMEVQKYDNTIANTLKLTKYDCWIIFIF